MILLHYHPGKHYCGFLMITFNKPAIKCLQSIEVFQECINFSGRTTFPVKPAFYALYITVRISLFNKNPLVDDRLPAFTQT